MPKELREIEDRCKLKRKFNECETHKVLPNGCSQCTQFLGLYIGEQYNIAVSYKRSLRDLNDNDDITRMTLDEYLNK